MRIKFNGFSTIRQIKTNQPLFCFKALKKRLEHLKSREKHWTSFMLFVAASCALYNRTEHYLTPTYSYKIKEVFVNVLWKRFLCEREPHHAITWDFVHRFLIMTILGIRFWAPEQYSWRFIQMHVLLSLTWIGVSSLKPPNVIQLETIFFLLAMSKKLVWAFFGSKTKLDFSRRITRVAN